MITSLQSCDCELDQNIIIIIIVEYVYTQLLQKMLDQVIVRLIVIWKSCCVQTSKLQDAVIYVVEI